MGKPLPLAVVLGADPALMLAGMFPLPENFEEIAFAGILRARATRVTRARTVDIDVPADAEFILEGEVPPAERRAEGPFGDHFGHYCDVADFPVFRVKTITRRSNPIYPAAIVGKPPQEDRYMGDASQMILGPLIRMIRPEVRDIWAYYEAGFHNLLVVSTEGRYTKEPVRTAMGILGEGQLGLTKVLVIVDQSVNARSFPDVLRAIRANFDPHEHFHLISRAPLDTLDFTSFKMHLGSRMIVDCTGPPAGEAPNGGHAAAPVNLDREPQVAAGNIQNWRLWEDTLLAVQLDRTEENLGKKVIDRLLADPSFAAVKIIAAVSPDVNIDDDVDLIWGIFTRFDPARDVTFREVSMSGIQPAYRGTMGIDATWKPGYPDAVEMPPDVVRRIDARWPVFFGR